MAAGAKNSQDVRWEEVASGGLQTSIHISFPTYRGPKCIHLIEHLIYLCNLCKGVNPIHLGQSICKIPSDFREINAVEFII